MFPLFPTVGGTVFLLSTIVGGVQCSYFPYLYGGEGAE